MDCALLALEIPNFISEHIKVIALISGITSAMIAMVMFLPRSNALGVGDWVKYFGLAFAFIAVQYFLHVVIRATTPELQQAYLYHLIWALCSTANSLLFLAAAIALLGRSNLFPRGIVIFGAFAALAISFEQYALQYFWLSWVRLPDALLSALCLGAAGVTIASNIGFHWRGFYWRRVLAVVAISVAIAYSALLLIYGFHPMLAQTSTVQSWVGPTPEKIRNIRNNPNNPDSSKLEDEIKVNETQKNLDALAFVIALVLKLGLFVPAYVLLITILKTSAQSDELLDRIGRERLSYLSGPSIVESISDLVKADRIELSFLVPGPTRRVASVNWRVGEKYREVAKIKPIDADPDVADVMNDGKVRRRLTTKLSKEERFITEDKLASGFRHLTSRANAVLVPIKYNGAVVGCLRIEQIRSDPFIETAIHQAKGFARLLTLSVQPYRYLATLDQITYRSGGLQVEHNIKNSEEAVENLVKIVHETLAPLATGLFLNVGFKERKKAVGKEEYHKARIFEIWEEPRDPRESMRLMQIPFPDFYEKLETYEADLIANLSDEAMLFIETHPEKKADRPKLGSFVFVTRSDKDEINKPTLGMFYLHRKVISSILSDAVLDLARDVHSEALKQFSLAVSLEGVGVAEWFEALDMAAKAGELSWSVSIDSSVEENSELSQLGEAPHVASVLQALRSHKAKIFEDIQSKDISLVRFNSASRTRSVIFLRLPRSERLICFGIERVDFGVELDFDSPWKAFLLGLRELAGSALERILSDTEFRRIQVEASQNQALATVAATTGTIIHQLVNMARDQMSASSTLSSSVRIGTLKTESERLKRIILSMNESGKSMLELTQSITNITKVDDTRPCNLAKAIENARDLFSISIAQNGIDFKFNVDPNLMIDVPYYVAALALANLVSNAKDALKSKPGDQDRLDKLIKVIAEEVQDADGKEWIHCHLMDTGSGISAGNRDKVFHLGFSTKPNSGGWGLYLVKRALRENGGDIELSEAGPKNTTFSMKFLKAKTRGKKGS
jgi:signal transduction histidine kinase